MSDGEWYPGPLCDTAMGCGPGVDCEHNLWDLKRCTEAELIAGLETENPTLLARIRADAAKAERERIVEMLRAESSRIMKLFQEQIEAGKADRVVDFPTYAHAATVYAEQIEMGTLGVTSEWERDDE